MESINKYTQRTRFQKAQDERRNMTRDKVKADYIKAKYAVSVLCKSQCRVGSSVNPNK